MGVWLVAHLVRDEGVVGSNPITPTSFLVVLITYAASYAERNSPVTIRRGRFMPIPPTTSEPASIGLATGILRAPRDLMRRLLPPAQLGARAGVGQRGVHVSHLLHATDDMLRSTPHRPATA